MRKEPWDSSSEKAKTLKIEDFGKPEKVREMAKPIRTAQNRYEVAIILKEIVDKGPLTNKNDLAVIVDFTQAYQWQTSSGLDGWRPSIKQGLTTASGFQNTSFPRCPAMVWR